MFQAQKSNRSAFAATLSVLELIYIATVHKVRGKHGNAVVGLLLSVFRALLMVVSFLVMMQVLGMRRFAIRGDFVLYVMSGIFMFTTHVRVLGNVSRADSPISGIMLHSPMNPVIAVVASALAALYEQFLAAVTILFVYHALIQPIEIHDPVGVLGMFMLAWGSGIGIGLLFYAASPWNPSFFGILTTVYMRVNMIASGKMFVANQLPGWLHNAFDWNPLFHIIDQGRGFMFLNYVPRTTSISYPIYFTLICILIGLMGQFFTRKFISASWSKR